MASRAAVASLFRTPYGHPIPEQPEVQAPSDQASDYFMSDDEFFSADESSANVQTSTPRNARRPPTGPSRPARTPREPRRGRRNSQPPERDNARNNFSGDVRPSSTFQRNSSPREIQTHLISTERPSPYIGQHERSTPNYSGRGPRAQGRGGYKDDRNRRMSQGAIKEERLDENYTVQFRGNERTRHPKPLVVGLDGSSMPTRRRRGPGGKPQPQKNMPEQKQEQFQGGGCYSPPQRGSREGSVDSFSHSIFDRTSTPSTVATSVDSFPVKPTKPNFLGLNSPRPGQTLSDDSTDEDEGKTWYNDKKASGGFKNQISRPTTSSVDLGGVEVIELTDSDEEEHIVLDDISREAAESAALENLRKEFGLDDHSDDYDQYDVTESLAGDLENLGLLDEKFSNQANNRQSFENFRFLLQYEITRVALAVGLSPEESATRIPAVVEELSEEFRSAKDRKELWTVMISFARQISNGKPFVMPEPLTDEIWLLINGNTPWSNEIKLSATAKLSIRSDKFHLAINLNPPNTTGGGNIFAQRFGSDRFLCLRISTDFFKSKPRWRGLSESELRAHTARWLDQKELSLLNRRWRCFFIKTETKKNRHIKEDEFQFGPELLNPDRAKGVSDSYFLVYYFAESGVGLGEVCYRTKDQLGFVKEIRSGRDEMIRSEMTRDDLIRWHMPFEKLMDADFSKTWDRIRLGLSTSVPTVIFQPDKIKFVDDIRSPKGTIMNDGCSVCSPKVMRMIREWLKLEETPVAIQGRIGGAKGMWFTDPEADIYSEEISITITASQRKFPPHDVDSDPDTMDWARRTLFVLNHSKAPGPTTLNLQFVPILASQGVPFEAFQQFLEQHLEEDLQELLEAASDRISLRTWLSSSAMRQRRQYGHVPLYLSGTPQLNDEQICMLLDAGFEPLKCGFLMDKLNTIVKNECNDILDGLHIRVPSSTSVFMLADPTGTLKPGEVSLQFSQGFLDTTLQIRRDCIEGDVLVGRNPAHLPTDIRKVRAVCTSHPGLRRLKDVIVFSTQGDIPLADMLSGGDYDGDKAWVCWDRRIVEPFWNNSSFAAFKRWKSDDWVEKTYPDSRLLRDLGADPNTPEFFKMFFSRGLQSMLEQDSLLGMCTETLSRYVYANFRSIKGIDRTALDLANLCGLLVDAPKQGIQPTPRTINWIYRLNKIYTRKPGYKTPKEKENYPTGDPSQWYILDRLVLHVGNNKVQEKQKQFEVLINRQGKWTDQHLTKRYHAFDELANKDESLRRVRGYLNDELEGIQRLWRKRMSPKGKDPSTYSFRAELETVYDAYVAIKPPPNVLNNPLVESWAADSDRTFGEWRLLKASMLYWMNHGHQKLPWWLIMPELCHMKAEESAIEARNPVPRTITADMYMVLKPTTRRFNDGFDPENDN
ncbi:RNA dependent RNA polymerase-domain-containing protein [Pyronema omphalodes]|nr:RNA dependent RNA polymerase-domain-containing protein [Pyronema omphalodes]